MKFQIIWIGIQNVVKSFIEYIPQIKYLTCAHCRRLLCVILPLVVNEENIWIVLYIDKKRRGEYFDSLGRCPFEHFKILLDVNCVEWIWNERQIQSVINKLCGHYCIFYCLYRSRGLDVRKIVGMFTKDTGLNDSMVHNFVCNV